MQKQFVQCFQNSNSDVTPQETIKAIKDAGFNSVFIQWFDRDWSFTQQQQVDLCKDLGLDVLFAHLGYKDINEIWLEGEKGDNLVKKYIRNLDECKVNNVNMVCMHLTSQSVAPGPNEIGIKRFQQIVDYAQNLGIKVAFENTKIFGYLEYLFDRIKNENAGICYDVGHCHCHFNDNFSWNKFKNKIFAIHLHDNDKTDDLHLLPFEGTIDWKRLVRELNEANYTGPVILESKYTNRYLSMPLLDFYKTSLDRAKQIYEFSILDENE